jgi:hypothetical protein
VVMPDVRAAIKATKLLVVVEGIGVSARHTS